MRSFRKFAFFTTIATYFLIFIGGLVRVVGAGLGCPDWPTCFGRWIPPTSIDQVPPEMADQFNITLAWIEYLNRLCGMTVGLLILATAIWAIIKYRPYKKILFPAMAAAVLTAVQGYQGSVVVSSLLEPVIISVHLFLALIIVSLLIYTTAQAYYIEKEEKLPKTTLPVKLSTYAAVLWLAGIVQIVLGTQIRAALETLAKDFPDLTALDWLSKVGAINHLHMTLGIILAAFTFFVTLKILKYKEHVSSLVQASAGLMSLMVMIQVFLGLSFMVFATQPVTQVFHLWVASLYIGTVLLIYISTRRIEKG